MQRCWMYSPARILLAYSLVLLAPPSSVKGYCTELYLSALHGNREAGKQDQALKPRARGVFDSASVFPVPRKPTHGDGWENRNFCICMHLRTASTDRECLNSTHPSGVGEGSFTSDTNLLHRLQAACIFRCLCSGHHCPAFRLGGDHALQYHSSAS